MQCLLPVKVLRTTFSTPTKSRNRFCPYTTLQVVFTLKSKGGIEVFYLLGLVKYSPGGVWIWIYHISFNEGFTESQVDKFMISEAYASV